MKTYIIQEESTSEVIAAITLKNAQKKTSIKNRNLFKAIKQSISEHFDEKVKSINNKSGKVWQLTFSVTSISEWSKEECERTFELIPIANYEVNN